MARPDPLETAEVRLQQRLAHEDVCKVSSMAGVGCGTHQQYRRNDHRATQRSVEYYQQRITMLQNGGYSALNSTHRAAVRVLAAKLCGFADSMGDNLPQECNAAKAFYAACSDRAGLLKQWEKADKKMLGFLWLSGCKSDLLAQAIIRASKPAPKVKKARKQVDVYAIF